MKHTDIFKAEELELAHICVIPRGWLVGKSSENLRENKVEIEVLIMAGNRISRTFNTLAVFTRPGNNKILQYGWNSESNLPLADVLKPYYTKYGILNECVVKDMASMLALEAMYWTSHKEEKLTVFPLSLFLTRDFSHKIDGIERMTIYQLMQAEVLDDHDRMKQIYMDVYPRLVNAIMGMDNARICGYGLEPFQGVIEMKEPGLCTSLPCLPNMFYATIEEGGKVYHFVECEKMGA